MRRLITAVAAALLVSTPALHAGKLYKWIDDSGQVRYGDRVPPEYAQRRNETLNSQGIVVETKAAQKTKEQLAEEQRVAALQAEEERKQREEARKDRILLDTFTNEDEMILTRDGKLEAIEAVIRVTKGRIEKLRQRLSDLTRRAANLERAGRPIAPELSEQIAESRSQIRHNLEYIENRKQEQHAIREKFEHDIKRFRKLKLAEAEARAAQH
jgi:chromosome segregation ATPase